MVVVQGVVEVKTDSFRSTVVVTLSVDVTCTHLYYCSMRCLYCKMLYNTNILQYVCVCVCVCVCMHVSTCVDVSGWMCLWVWM